MDGDVIWKVDLDIEEKNDIAFETFKMWIRRRIEQSVAQNISQMTTC